MAGVNKAIIVGNLGQDPEVRYMGSGEAVATLSIATSETWKDKQTGERREKTEWHRVALFGRLAEVARDYLRKGGKVYVEGQLRTRKWQAQDGSDRYTTEIVVGMGGTLQMLDPRPQSAPAGSAGGQPRAPAASASGGSSEPPPFDDDIPF